VYDSSKVITGIVIFVLLIASPFLYNATFGNPSYVPEIKFETEATKCIESKEYMRANHMDMLDDWRNEVVRGESRIYKASDGKEYEKSLTNTCMSCHISRTEFCVKCHDYAAVKQPACWNCHNDHTIASSPSSNVSL
jgi:hypothetical protein